VLTAIIWGLVRVSPNSSRCRRAHISSWCRLLDLDEPDLATTAVLHIGTLLALLWFCRRVDRNGAGPRAPQPALWMLLIIGTIPAAVIGLALRGPIEIIFSDPWIVAVSLVSRADPRGPRRLIPALVPSMTARRATPGW
jgi:undecaprenyl-diphosphatase